MSQIITRAERLARKQRITGAGDAFALLAQPIARAVDKVAGTKLAECGACKKRRERWNKALPFVIPKA